MPVYLFAHVNLLVHSFLCSMLYTWHTPDQRDTLSSLCMVASICVTSKQVKVCDMRMPVWQAPQWGSAEENPWRQKISRCTAHDGFTQYTIAFTQYENSSLRYSRACALDLCYFMYFYHLYFLPVVYLPMVWFPQPVIPNTRRSL